MRILLVFILITFTISAKAEIYEGYFLKFTIENISGEKVIGHSSIPSDYFDRDSLENTEYLKRTLGSFIKSSDKKDSLTYYKYRIKYVYDSRMYDIAKKDTVYCLVQKATISLKSIKSIKINEIINFIYLTSIANDFKISDTSWLKKKPIKMLTVDGYLCAYTIFVHKNSKNIDNLAKQLQQKQKEKDNLKISEDKYDETANSVRSKIDNDITEIIQKFNNEKVVVIGDYTD